MRLLLHACCGPCSLEPTRVFSEEGIGFDLDYENPNIFPREEHGHRLETLRAFVAEPLGVRLYEGPYDPEAWEEQVAVHGTDREARCRACYRMRLERTAARAAELGYDAVSTTLAISPYQFTDAVLEELDSAARRHGIVALGRDFRDLYPEATRRSRALGMYRQNSCGCRFSIAEAKVQREQARAEREREKALKHRALILAAASGAANQPSQL